MWEPKEKDDIQVNGLRFKQPPVRRASSAPVGPGGPRPLGPSKQGVLPPDKGKALCRAFLDKLDGGKRSVSEAPVVREEEPSASLKSE